MIKSVWINLPVKNISTSVAFYKALGFTPTPHGQSDHSAGFQIGTGGFVMMLFQEQVFKSVVQAEPSDALMDAEMMISVDAESREEVDGLAKKAADAGGTIFLKPTDSQGYMYGCGFADPDNHRWNVIYMDAAKMPKS